MVTGVNNTLFKEISQFPELSHLTAETVSGCSIFALIDKSARKVLAVEKYPTDELPEIASMINDLQKRAGKISLSISIGTPLFTMIPEELNANGKELFLLSLNADVPENAKVLNYPLHLNNARLIYALPESAWEFVRSRFPNAYFHHPCGSFAETIIRKKHLGNHFYLHLIGKKMILGVVRFGNQLRLLNMFDWQKPEDCLYYLVNAMEEEELGQGDIKIWLSGEASSIRDLEVLLKKYFREVAYTELNDTFQNSGFVEPQELTLLITETLCAL